MLRRAGLLAALTALLVPAVAGTATADAAKRKKKRSPVVTKVTPKNAFVGDTLTIRGRYFRRGVNKNTVAFKPRGKKVVFVKAEKGTTKLLKVTLPKRLEKSMTVQNGTPVPTRMQLRVLSAQFGKRFTKLSRSPIVGPEKPPAPPKPPTADPDADCDGDGLKNRDDADDDNDLLGDDLEKTLKLNGCDVDSDGDLVEDGYEYAAAQDLNDDEITLVPYPQKLPYPNALDGTDGNTDHDGDALTLKDEYDLWKFVGNRVLEPLSYSAGEQFSVFTGGGAGVRQPSLAAAGYDKQVAFLTWAGQAGYATVPLATVGSTVNVWNDTPEWWAARAPFDIRDMNRDGLDGYEQTYYDDGNNLLNDAERDEDADGLSNWAESTGCMVRGYWDELYDGETTYPLQYGSVRLDDPDSDGDGVRDGADDQDHDDVPNIMECSRSLAAGLAEDDPSVSSPPAGRPWKGFVNPFNPCLPHWKSRTCKRIVTIGSPWAPFNADEDYYLIKN
jgi:IPT/TIG domain-containing protein